MNTGGAVVRVVHYINQFFAGQGGEDAAGLPPVLVEGPVGPGRKLQALLGDGFEIVATVWCGDDHAAADPAAAAAILALAAGAEPQLLLAGPAFGSGRYGLACARVAAAATRAGIPAVAAMHEDNPGVEEAGATPVVGVGATARTMQPSLEQLASAACKVAAGAVLTRADGRAGRIPRRASLSESRSAERAVDLLLARLAGARDLTEVPLPSYDRVAPAAAVDDPGAVVVALVTEGALVPDDNPEGLESARATRWLRYPLKGVDSLPAGRWRSVHGGFSTQWANEDPHRILPLDVARDLESEGAIGRLHDEYLVTTGNGTTVADARRFGVEWAADLRRSEVRAAILTAT
jgi:glycine reductase complex component B subunit gamma